MAAGAVSLIGESEYSGLVRVVFRGTRLAWLSVVHKPRSSLMMWELLSIIC